ncbi:MAG: hypothetical protein GY830_02155 [Bacteroidetes bacterium]|nr:hypothetical protein [Bacteroidota bacterium]
MMDKIKKITTLELESVIGENKYKIIDIRDSNSYEVSHLPGAKNMADQAQLEKFIASEDKSQSIIVCCYHGFSSLGVVERLVDEGFKDVYNFEGGFNAWELKNKERKK